MSQNDNLLPYASPGWIKLAGRCLLYKQNTSWKPVSLSPHSRGLPGSRVDTLVTQAQTRRQDWGGEADPAVTMGRAAPGLGHGLQGGQRGCWGQAGTEHHGLENGAGVSQTWVGIPPLPLPCHPPQVSRSQSALVRGVDPGDRRSGFKSQPCKLLHLPVPRCSDQ